MCIRDRVTTANVTGAYVLGNGAALSSITGANVTGVVAQATQANTANSATTATSATTAGTVTTNAQPNITSVGTLTSLTVSGSITGGNIGNAATYLYGDVSNTTGGYGNSQVATYLNSSTMTQDIATLGNATFVGSFAANTNGRVGYLTFDGANTVIATSNSQRILVEPVLATTANLNVGDSLNMTNGGDITTTGNISGGYLLGNIAFANGYSASSIFNGTSNVTIPTANGNITFNNAGTQVGVLSGLSVAFGYGAGNSAPVSYTHLTLPTNREV